MMAITRRPLTLSLSLPSAKADMRRRGRGDAVAPAITPVRRRASEHQSVCCLSEKNPPLPLRERAGVRGRRVSLQYAPTAGEAR